MEIQWFGRCYVIAFLLSSAAFATLPLEPPWQETAAFSTQWGEDESSLYQQARDGIHAVVDAMRDRCLAQEADLTYDPSYLSPSCGTSLHHAPYTGWRRFVFGEKTLVFYRCTAQLFVRCSDPTDPQGERRALKRYPDPPWKKIVRLGPSVSAKTYTQAMVRAGEQIRDRILGEESVCYRYGGKPKSRRPRAWAIETKNKLVKQSIFELDRYETFFMGVAESVVECE